MARPASKQPTDGEMEIRRILWEEGPAELGRIRERLREERPVATTTVATRLDVMLEKGLVRRNEEVRPYRWTARLSRSATARGIVGRVLDAVFDGSAKGLVAHLIEEGRLGNEERRELLDLLDREADPGDLPPGTSEDAGGGAKGKREGDDR